MVADKRFDGLSGLGLELHFVENDERLAFHQTDIVNQLKPEEDVIEVRHVFEQIFDFQRALGEVDKNIGGILAAGELLDNGGFTDASGTLHQESRFPVACFFPLQQTVVDFTFEYSFSFHCL